MAQSPGPGIPADGLVDIGGRSLYIECTGSGGPTIVLEAGLGMNHTTWQKLAPLLTGERVRVCSYDRAGRGTSDPADPPRTAGDVVDDLEHLLARAGIETPVVLVGHSFGGVSARLFAARHPDLVAGLVLIDPPPETWLDDACSVDATLCEQMRSALAPEASPEGIDWVATVDELSSAGPLPPMPLVVLAATERGSTFPADAIALHTTRLGELADSVPGGRLIVVDSGHFIQLDRPESVAEAVHSVLEAVRAAP